jgi:hypothetical protein
MNKPILAGSETLELPVAVQLFAGEAPITTNRAQGATSIKLPQYAVIALVADKIVRYNAAGNDGSEKAVGILADELDTIAYPGAWAPYYTGGDFNHKALVFPALVSAAVADGDNTGNGTVGSLTVNAGAPAETWTLTLITAAANGGTFSVVGSVSGAKANATVGSAYNNGSVAFTIADGSTDFVVGDTFTIQATQPTLTQARAVFAALSTIKISKTI